MRVLRYKKTGVNSDAWTSSKQIPNAESHADAYAYVDEEQNTYKLAHHFLTEDGAVGEASSKACQSAIAYLNSQGKKDGMSDEDIAAVYAHLSQHLRDAGEEPTALNAVGPTSHRNEVIELVENSFQDDGQGTLTFPAGQIVMDDQELKSGYKYDIPSMNLDEYNGTVTVDHDRSIGAIVAKTQLVKRGNQIVMSQLQFAIDQNPIAQVAYDLYRNGYAKDFSIETYGPWPDVDRTFMDAVLSGFSCVVVGNSRPASLNKLIANSLATAKSNNLDVHELEEQYGVKAAEPQLNSHKDDDMTYKTVKNSQTFTVKVSYKNAAGDAVENELAAGASIDVAEDQAEAVEAQVKNAQDPADKPITPADLTEAVNAALAKRDKETEEHFEELKNSLLEQNSALPAWRPNNQRNRVSNAGSKLADMDDKERTALQLQALVSVIKDHDWEASKVLKEINGMHLEAQQKAGLVSNSLDMPDLGNFVLSPQMITDIKELASDYGPLLNVFQFEDTPSLETAWIKATGDIDMDDVDMDDNGNNADLKPIKKPSFTTDSQRLMEFAAVTPVKSSAIRFSAVDIVAHITKIYSRAYRRKLAQSVIGRLQMAIDGNHNSVPFDYSHEPVDALITLITAWSEVAEHSPNGSFLMTQGSRGFLTAMALRSGPNGPLSGLFTQGPNGLNLFLDRPYVVVPGDLMPNINTATTKQFSFEGNNVTVNQGIFYADPDNFLGKVSGGLNFQVSDVAAYEENNTVKSSFQRDELVFRGYGYRSSALTFPDQVSGVGAPGIS